MIEGRIAGLAMSEALGLKIQQENYGIYQERLDSLRRGEAGEKIRCGLGMAQITDWGNK